MEPYRLAIVIPARNEVARLPGTLAQIAAAVVPGWEIVSVHLAENGSSDDTAELADRLGQALGLPLVIHRLSVAGKAGAVRATMPLAAGDDVDGVLFMDADNATDLGQLIHFDPSDRSAIQIGSRHLSDSTIVSLEDSGRSGARRLLSFVMRVMSRHLLGLHQADTQCGFKLFPRPLVTPLFRAVRSDSWVFDAEILARAQLAGIRVTERPVRWVEMPGSKVRPLADGLGSFVGLLAIWVMLSRERLSGQMPVPDLLAPR